MSGAYDIFSTPEYWAGNTGYRPDADGIGYRDFLESNLPRVDYIASKRPGKVLDMGCAYGFLVAHLRERCIDAWGIDISSIAMERAPVEVKPYLTQGSIAKLPFPDQSVDMTVSYGVLEHLTLEDAEACCEEIKRVSHRGIHAIGLSTELSAHLPKEQLDKTHRTLKDFYWWKERLGENFEVWEGADETWRCANQFKVLVMAPMAFPVGLSGYGGIERLTFLLSRELARRGIDVTVAAGDGSYTAPGVKIISMGKANPLDYQSMEWLAFSILRPTIENYNVILDLSHSKWAGRLLPFHTRQINPMWHCGSLMKPPLPQWNLTALSEFQARECLFYEGHGTKVLDIHILDNTGEPAKNEDMVFLCVGKVNPRKGTLATIKLCRKLGVRLYVVGPLGEVPEYNRAVLDLCCNGVEYLGELPHKTIQLLAANAEGLIYMMGEPEAHSHKTVDCLGAGCSVLSYKRYAMAEIVEHGVDGFLAESDEEMENYIKQIGSLDKSRIRERAWARWGPEPTMKRLISLLVEGTHGARW